MSVTFRHSDSLFIKKLLQSMHSVYIGSIDSKALDDAGRCLLVLSFLNGLATDMQGDYLAPFFQRKFLSMGSMASRGDAPKIPYRIVDQHVIQCAQKESRKD